jgi:serine/threonine protein kinase
MSPSSSTRTAGAIDVMTATIIPKNPTNRSNTNTTDVPGTPATPPHGRRPGQAGLRTKMGFEKKAPEDHAGFKQVTTPGAFTVGGGGDSLADEEEEEDSRDEVRSMQADKENTLSRLKDAPTRTHLRKSVSNGAREKSTADSVIARSKSWDNDDKTAYLEQRGPHRRPARRKPAPRSSAEQKQQEASMNEKNDHTTTNSISSSPTRSVASRSVAIVEKRTRGTPPYGIRSRQAALRAKMGFKEEAPDQRHAGIEQVTTPGALTVGGGDASSADEEEEEFQSSSFETTEVAEIQTSAAGLATEDPIQAMLVEDQEELKERELAEREAKIKQRELELERKMQQMAAGSAVRAQVVAAAPEPTKTKNKGLLGMFRFGRGQKKTADSPKQAKRTSVTTQLVTSNAAKPATLVNKLVENQLGTSPRGRAAARTTNLGEFASQFNRKPHTSTPLFDRDEIRLGEKLGEGKFNTVITLKGLDLQEAWEYPESQRAGLAQEYIEKQSDLREELARKCQMNGRTYALKYLQKDLDACIRPQAALELMSEASLLATLSHENIIQVAGMSEGSLAVENGSSTPNLDFFFIMEELQDNLFDRLTKSWRRKVRGPQFFLDRVKVATDLASAIDYLHSLNIMICDLKPENVAFSGRDGHLKLYNFGGAKALTASTKPYDSYCYTMSPYEGTHPYVAPEVVFKRPSGISVDAYAFAIILWEIMTMKEPFADLMVHEYTEQVFQQNKRPRLDKKTPVELNEIMAACWDSDPRRRPCMKDVHLNLLKFQQQLDVPETKKGFFR